MVRDRLDKLFGFNVFYPFFHRVRRINLVFGILNTDTVEGILILITYTDHFQQFVNQIDILDKDELLAKPSIPCL